LEQVTRIAALLAAAALLLGQNALGQNALGQNAQPSAVQLPSDAEQSDLMHAVNEGSNSTIDLIHAFEAFLQKYPNTNYRPDIEKNLTKASIDIRDSSRIAKYGELVLAKTPDDVVSLDAVSQALVEIGGRDNAERAQKYARTFEDLIEAMPPPAGADAPKIQEERDRADARALMTQGRARLILGDKEESLRMNQRAYSVFPNEETARATADALLRLGRDSEAIERLAEAFIIPDSRAKNTDLMSDRLRLGALWRRTHESERGLGDEILTAYDRASSAVELRRKKLLALDPNGAARGISDFTVTGLDGKKLQMSSLLGKVVVLDFWATWCVPCRAQRPVYDDVMQHYKDRGDVVFLPLSTDEDRSVVEPFLESQMWDKHVFFDDGLQRVLGVSQIPTTIVLNKQGLISSRMNGFAPDRFQNDLIERIDTALLEPPIPNLPAVPKQ
jgi:thiol-disulfide isomerase/thioredoxin